MLLNYYDVTTARISSIIVKRQCGGMIAYLDRMPSLLLLLYSVRFELLELVVLLSHDDTTKTVEFPKN